MSIIVSTGNRNTVRSPFQRSSIEYDQVQPKPSKPTVSKETEIRLRKKETKKERKKETKKERKKEKLIAPIILSSCL